MKLLYIILIVLIIIIITLYFYKNSNHNEHFKSSNNFKFVSDNNENLDDDFGDFIKEPNNAYNNEYIEGFTKNITRRENFIQEQEIKLLPEISAPRYVWTYWENKAGRSKPYAHI